MNIGAVIIIGLIILALLGIPIYLSLGISALIAMAMADLPFEILAQKNVCRHELQLPACHSILHFGR